MSIEQRPEGLVKLTGTIENYKVTRTEASFIFTDADRTQLGVVAIAAGIAGLSGPAISTAAYAASAEEDADYVEFDLDGKPVKGWVWRSPFKEGDAVEVAAEWRDDHYETAGIARPADRVIALYPHCSRGKARHIKNGAKWWALGVALFFIGGGGATLGVMLMLSDSPRNLLSDFFSEKLLVMIAGTYGFFGLMTISLTSKWMPFVRLTEKICRTLGIPNASNVDLVQSSKAQRKPDDPGEYGTFYFRY